MEEQRIFVLNGAEAHVRQVEVKRYIKDRAVLAGDIHDGDQVIISNLDRLADGMAVSVEDSDDPREATVP